MKVGCSRLEMIKVQTLPHFVGELPQYQTAGSSGFDLRAQIRTDLVLAPGQRALVATGLCFAIPRGMELQIRARSGWALKHGIALVNAPGTIDSDYRGEVKVIIINLGSEPVVIRDQDRIAQAVLTPVIQAELIAVATLDETERGLGGFGSTKV